MESVERLSRVTKLLRTQRTLPAKLETIVAIATRTVPSCHSAGISLLIDGQPTTSAVSDRLAVEIDLIQYETGEGPCLSAMRDSKIVRVDVIGQDSRFSRFTPGALDRDVNSFLSLPLNAGGRTVGAMNLYSHKPNAFDEEAERVAEPLADYAAEAVSTSPLYAYALEMVDGLMETMESQALIGQATGVLMATEQRTSGEALDRLRELALASGESMRTVADWVLEERPLGPSPSVPGQDRVSDSEDG